MWRKIWLGIEWPSKLDMSFRPCFVGIDQHLTLILGVLIMLYHVGRQACMVLWLWRENKHIVESNSTRQELPRKFRLLPTTHFRGHLSRTLSFKSHVIKSVASFYGVLPRYLGIFRHIIMPVKKFCMVRISKNNVFWICTPRDKENWPKS